MKTYTWYVVSLIVLLFVFSFVQVTANGVSIGASAAKAESANDANPLKENAVLDKNNPHVKKVMDAQKRHTPKLMQIAEVVGTAAGLTENNEPAIIVFTKQEMKKGTLPEYLEDVPVLTQVTGTVFIWQNPLKKPAGVVKPSSKFSLPVPIGVSTGNEYECSAGTIGARVKDASGNVYVLSNNHVLAMQGNAPSGSEILQPGLYDTRCRTGQSNVIGTLYEFIPINFAGGENMVDAAIATSSTSSLDNATPPDGYGKPNALTYTQATNNPPYLGQSVKKYGRTTKLTDGTISGINATVSVCYDPSCSLKATFSDQIVVTGGNFSKAGDSGSLIVSNDDPAYPIALLFAGANNITFANQIDTVLSSLNVTIDGK